MPVLPSTASPTPGPTSRSGPKNLVAEALYNWCRTNQKIGHVFTQNDLVGSGLIPGNDAHVLLEATQQLTKRRLFKIHEFRGREDLGWELIEESAAASYEGLTSDEQMVYASIDSAGTAGLWTKTIKAKSGVHAKVLDRVYKQLETKNLIKPMKSVKNPGRKMYILSTLQPSEEATGGTWFNDGRLDVGMIAAVSQAVETHCSLRSWHLVQEDETHNDIANNKRKEPDDGFDVVGTGKAKKTEDGKSVQTQAANHKPKKQTTYEPHDPGYEGYPTLQSISLELKRINVIQLAIPNNALAQLLDVMVYDDRIHKVSRQARADETPDDPDKNEVVMYRSFSSPIELGQRQGLEIKIERGSKSARRQQELEDIGKGGFSEVPCLDCPLFDICGDGGPVNVKTCTYFGEWFKKMEEADNEAEDPWPGTAKPIKQPRR